MFNINKAIIYGNLTRDPELKALPSGTNVVSFGVATNRTYKDKEGVKKEETEFHNVVAFGKTADVIAQYMKKGSPIYVEGRLQTRSWEAEEVKHYRTEIVVDSFQFGPSAQGNSRTEREDRGEDTDEPRSVDAASLITAPVDETDPEGIPF